MKKVLVVLGANTDQLFMIKTANAMGYETVALDANPNALGLKEATYSAIIDFSDIEVTISYLESLIKNNIKISGVLTMGSDVPHIVAKIAKHFSWIAPSEETALLTTNKFAMKECFSNYNIAIPKYKMVNSSDEIKNIWEVWACKNIILKPIDSAGSRGVSLVSTQSELEELFIHAKKNSRTEQVMVEEYIEGVQISTESVIFDNNYFHLGFAERVYNETQNFYPYIMENGGWQPSLIGESKYRKICKLLEDISKAIGLKKGILKGDIVYSEKYKKPMVIEVASRLSGGDFSASLVPMSTGVNYVKTAIQIALNEEIDLKELNEKKQFTVVNRYFFIPEGTLEEIIGIDKIKKLLELKKLEFNYKIGDAIPKIRSHGDRIGVFVLCSKERKDLDSLIDFVYETVKFKVDGKIYCGHPKNYRIDS